MMRESLEKRLKRATLGNAPKANYCAAIHLGRQHYFILGTLRRPNPEHPEPDELRVFLETPLRDHHSPSLTRP